MSLAPGDALLRSTARSQRKRSNFAAVRAMAASATGHQPATAHRCVLDEPAKREKEAGESGVLDFSTINFGD